MNYVAKFEFRNEMKKNRIQRPGYCISEAYLCFTKKLVVIWDALNLGLHKNSFLVSNVNRGMWADDILDQECSKLINVHRWQNSKGFEAHGFKLVMPGDMFPHHLSFYHWSMSLGVT